jgi:YhcH/YjgK/YiaL family protein
MILDVLSNADRYRALHPGLAAGLDYLRSGDWRTLPLGKHAVDGERLLIIIEHPQGKGRDEARLEAHQRYIDIQLCTKGQEVIGWRPLSACNNVTEPYQASRDIMFFGDTSGTWLELDGEKFLVFFPEDAHAPLAGIGPLQKVVMKVAVEW